MTLYHSKSLLGCGRQHPMVLPEGSLGDSEVSTESSRDKFWLKNCHILH